jgi:hypothetical protein
MSNPVRITDEERHRRQAAIDQSLASVRLEGLEPSEDAKAIARRYIEGELTVIEMGEEIRALNARQFGSVHVSGD